MALDLLLQELRRQVERERDRVCWLRRYINATPDRLRREPYCVRWQEELEELERLITALEAAVQLTREFVDA